MSSAGGTETLSRGTGVGSYNSGGVSFACGAYLGSDCAVGLTVTYTLIVPDFSNAPPYAPQVVTAPFTASINFGKCSPDFTTCYDGTFRGAGIATVTLGGSQVPNLYTYQGAVYDFAAIPESSTRDLAILGLAAIAIAQMIPLKRHPTHL